MKQQVLVIHGGGSFIPEAGETMLDMIAKKEPKLEDMRRKSNWREGLQGRLGEQFDILSPRMPNADAPQYSEWEAWFEKMLPLLDDNVIFVGHSLGAMFLAKYFSENPKKDAARALFLVAPPFGRLGRSDWELKSIENLPSHADEVYLYHSADDAVVPFDAFESYKEVLPDVHDRAFDGRNHFFDDNFPEIVDDIKALVE